MRLIDADALRESIITRQTEMSYEDAWALTCVDNAPTIEPYKWVPVSERLPEQQQKVLIQDFGEITIGYLNAENKWRDLTNLDDYLKGVEAWMPLPDLWRKGEVDG